METAAPASPGPGGGPGCCGGRLHGRPHALYPCRSRSALPPGSARLAVWPPASYWPSLSSVPAMVPSRCHRHPHVAAGQLSTRPPLGIAGAPPPPSPVLFLHRTPSRAEVHRPLPETSSPVGVGGGGPFAPPSGGGGGAGWRSGGSGAGGGHTEGAEETLGLGDFLAPPGAGCAPARPRGPVIADGRDLCVPGYLLTLFQSD